MSSNGNGKSKLIPREDLRNIVATVFIGIFGFLIVWLLFLRSDVTTLTISGDIDANIFVGIFTGTIIAMFAWLGFSQQAKMANVAIETAQKAATGDQGEWARRNSLSQINSQIAYLKQDEEWTLAEIEAYKQWEKTYPDMFKWAMPRLNRELEIVRRQIKDKLAEREEIVNSPHF